MADVTVVSSEDEFVQEIVSDEDLSLTDDGARELWRIWTFRRDNGATDDVLVALPEWFAQEEFDRNRPYFFAQIEHDDPDKGAVLFSDSRVIDINVVENEIWDRVTITEALEVLDQTHTDHIDEQGKVWTPRSLMHVFRIEDDGNGGGLADTASP